MAGDQRDRGVRTLDAFVHAGDSLEDLLGVEIEAGDRRLQLVREDVDEQFGVGAGVEVAAVLAEELFGELARVGEVAVVDQDDSVRGVDVERLGFFFVGSGALRRIPHMAKADIAEQGAHVASAERLTHLPLGLEDVEDTVGLSRGDAGGVLTPVLKKQQCVVDLLVGVLLTDDTDDSAHGLLLRSVS